MFGTRIIDMDLLFNEVGSFVTMDFTNLTCDSYTFSLIGGFRIL